MISLHDFTDCGFTTYTIMICSPPKHLREPVIDDKVR